jgi:hypothetical protein
LSLAIGIWVAGLFRVMLLKLLDKGTGFSKSVLQRAVTIQADIPVADEHTSICVLDDHPLRGPANLSLEQIMAYSIAANSW